MLGAVGRILGNVVARRHPSWQPPAVVLSRCADCGDVELTVADVVVRVCVSDGSVSYAFRCPACGIASGLPLEPLRAERLLRLGARHETWVRPLELLERPADAPPITESDVEAFAARLAAGEASY